MALILQRFYKVTPSPTLVSRADHRVERSLPALRFDVSKMCLTSWLYYRTPRSFQFCVQLMEENNARGLQSFLSPTVLISVQRTFDDVWQHSIKKILKRKSTRKGAVVLWFNPIYFLTRNDW